MEPNEETALAATPATPEQIAALATQNKHDMAGLDDLAKTGDYLGRVQLYGANSGAVKKGEIGMAHYGYVTSGKPTDLGKDVNVVPIAWRPMAMDMTGEIPVRVFEKDSPAFKSIQEKSFLPDSGCAYGADFLIWIPSIKKFATLFFGSKSARNEIKPFVEFLGKPANLFSKFVEQKKYSWHVMNSRACTEPVLYPDAATLIATKEKFENEASSKAPEKAEPASGRDR